MNVELTRAERIVLSQAVNIGLNSATLRDHILLEGIYKSLDIENMKVPIVLDYVSPEEAELFHKYDGKAVSEIENEDHKKLIQEAMHKQKADEAKMFDNEEQGESFDLSKDQIDMLKRFFETDKRPFRREYHSAIVALNGKLFEAKK